MRKLIMLVVGVAMFLGGALRAQDISGNWQGTLQAGQGLRTVLKISQDNGQWKAVMYSVDQGGQPIRVTSITLQGSAITLRSSHWI